MICYASIRYFKVLFQCSEGVMREKICEMVSVMRKAATVDDESADQEHEKVTQLETENRGLKEMLKIHRQLGVSLNSDVITFTQGVQTNDNDITGASSSSTTAEEEDEDITPESSDVGDLSDDLDNSVIENIPDKS